MESMTELTAGGRTKRKRDAEMRYIYMSVHTQSSGNAFWQLAIAMQLLLNVPSHPELIHNHICATDNGLELWSNGLETPTRAFPTFFDSIWKKIPG